MATTDNVMFEQLLEQMKELNRNLETTSFAFNSLTMQLSSKDLGATAMNSIPQSNTKQANSDASANGKQTPSLTNNSDNGASNQAPRAIGYINWNSSHDILKTQRLIKMTSIRAALEKLQSDDTKNIAGKTDNDDYDEYDDDHYEGDPIMSKINGENHSGHFTFNIQVPHVDKEWRFPPDAVYVDVSSPLVQGEIDFMNKINVQPTNGMIERFLSIVESEMHTCDSFEKKYGLKWV